MPEYRYLGLDPNGHEKRGKISAAHERDAEERLDRMGITVVKLKPIRSTRLLPSLSRSIPLVEVAGFYDRLADSLHVGLPLVQVLEENAKQLGNRRLKEAVQMLRVQVEEGRTLSQALQSHPDIFDRLQVGIVRMGEVSGTLPDALRKLADFLMWQAEQKGLIRKALIYPVFILIAVFVVTGIWVGYVLPQVSTFLQNLDVSLPAATRAILTASDFIRSWWLLLSALFGAAGAGFWFWSRTGTGREFLDRLYLRVPILGRLLKLIITCRLCVNFSMMLESGVSIGTIFDTLTSGALGNRSVEKDLERVKREVLAGRSLHEAFSDNSFYPHLFLSGLRTGELSGTLPQIFRKLGEYYDKEVNREMSALSSVFEPVSLLILGGIFGAVILAILLPLYDVFTQVRAY